MVKYILGIKQLTWLRGNLACFVLCCVAGGNAAAVNYIYPNAQGSFTTFVLGGSLSATTTDTLSFNASSTFTNTFWARLLGTGNIPFQLNGVGSATISLTTAATLGKVGVSVQNDGNFTIPAGLTLNITTNGSSSFVKGVLSQLSSAASVINNFGTVSIQVNAGSSDVIAIDASTFPRSVNNQGNVTVNITSGTPSIVFGIGGYLGNYIINSGAVSVTAPGVSGTLAGIYAFNVPTVTNSGTVSCSGSGAHGIRIDSSSGTTTFINSNNVTAPTALMAQGTVNTFLRGGIITGNIQGSTTTTFDNNATTTIIGNISSNPFTVSGGATASITGDISSSDFTVSNLGTANITGNVSSSNITLNAGATASLSGNLSSATTATINNTSFTIGGNVSSITTFSVGASTQATINGTFSGSGLNNAGTTTFKNTFTPSGTVTNSGILEFDGASAALGGNLTGSGAGSIVFGNNTATNFTLTNAISAIPSITVKAGSTLTVGTGGGFSGTTALVLQGSLTNNDALTLGSNISVSNTGAIINNANKTLTLSGATFSNSGVITNNGILSIVQNTTLTGRSITTASTGSVVVSGQRIITAANYVNNGTQNFTITDANNFDSLTCNCSADLTNASITITSPLAGGNSSFQWAVFSATSLTPPAAPIILPASTLFNLWGTFIQNNTIYITYQSATYSSIATPGINAEIGAVLDDMFANISNSSQQTLFDAFSSLTSAAAINDALHQMIPNQNNYAYSLKLQNTIFQQGGNRIAAVRNDMSSAYSSGDDGDSKSVWIAPFGSSATQDNRGINQGYTAKSYGVLVGVDSTIMNDHLIGAAFGSSHTTVTELSNSNFLTKENGYHVLVYGNINCPNIFYDWFVSGTYSNNKGSRNILVGNYNLSTYSNFYNLLGGAKLDIGQNYRVFDFMSIAPVSEFQYVLSYQPEYDESGSAAALNVSPNRYNNVLTIGAGVRLTFVESLWWLFGTQELRAMARYDAVASAQDVTANFVAGSENFSLNSTEARTALVLEANFNFELSNSLILDMTFDYEARQSYRDYSGMLKFRYLL